MGKRQRLAFGSIRELESGRFQARYETPDGRRLSGGAHDSYRAAQAALATIQADVIRGTWDDPARGRVNLGRYALETIASIKLSDRTRGEYLANWRNHLARAFGSKNLSDVTHLDVKRWFATMPEGSARRNSYTVLSRVFSEARDDDLITVNPCRIRGAFRDVSRPREHMPLSEFVAIVEHIPDRLKPLYWLMLAGHLRVAEAVALHRSDLDLEAGVLHVTKSLLEKNGQRFQVRTKNGDHRHVTLPGPVIAMMREYLLDHPRIGFAPLFDAPRGSLGIGRNLVQRTWARARAEAGFPQHHVHDIRHSGLTLATEGGASLREVMARGGHRTQQAALRYQHVVASRQRAVADSMGAIMATVGAK